MRITFVLPAPARVPQGGAAVVFRHAAGLVTRGHEVTVVSPRQIRPGLRGRAMRVAVRLRDRLHRVGSVDYYKDAGVRSVTVDNLQASSLPDAEAVIATGVQTSRPVAALPTSKGEKLYFVQGDEWFADADARQTWHLPMARITCAEWLAREIRAAGETVEAVVPNAIDPAAFGLDAPIEDRPDRVVALYHRHPVKGPDVLLAALDVVRQSRPGAEVTVFAARPPSHRLPAGVRVMVRPDRAALRRLFNSCAVLIHSSRSEGWPLVPMEAAACGCAVAATANPGIQEYLRAGESMQAVRVGDGDALGHAALEVLSNPDLRLRLAKAARQSVLNTSWSESTGRLEQAILRVAS